MSLSVSLADPHRSDCYKLEAIHLVCQQKLWELDPFFPFFHISKSTQPLTPSMQTYFIDAPLQHKTPSPTKAQGLVLINEIANDVPVHCMALCK